MHNMDGQIFHTGKKKCAIACVYGSSQGWMMHKAKSRKKNMIYSVLRLEGGDTLRDTSNKTTGPKHWQGNRAKLHGYV